MAEEIYKQIVEKSSLGFWLLDSKFITTFINDGLASILGYPADEIIGSSFVKFIDNDDRKNAEHRLADIVLKKTENCLLRFIKKDGTRFSAGLTFNVINNGNGISILALFSNVIQNKQIYGNLFENSEIFNQLFFNNPNPMWIYERDTLRFLEVNDASVVLYGYSREEFLQMKITDIRPQEDIPELLEYLECTEKLLNPVSGWKHRLKNGSLIYVDIIRHFIEYNGKKASLVTVNNMTERMKMHEELQKSEARYKALFDSADAGIVYCSTCGDIILVNEVAAAYFGGTPSNFASKNIKDILPKGLAESVKSSIDIAVNSKTSFEKEEYSDGQDPAYMIMYQPMVHASGSVYGIQIIFHDINKSKKIEKAIRESETRFRRLFEDIVQIPVQGYDVDHKVLFWNKASEKAYGYTKEEAIGKKLEDLIIPEHMKDDIHNAIEDFYKKDIHIPSGEIGLRRKDGSLIDMYSSHVIIKNYDGKKEMYCVDVDMTQRNEAEKQIAFQARMLNAVGESIIATDRNGTIFYLNEAAEKLYDWKREEVLNKNIISVITAPELKKQAEQIARKSKRGMPYNIEFSFPKKDGRILHIFGTNSPLYNPIGELIGIIGISFDISDIKNKEQELSAAKNKAEEMNKIKTAFLTNMSHELRTPLVGILGFADILFEEMDNPVFKNIAGSIVFSGKRLLSTLNGILDLSKIEANRMELNYSAFKVIKEVNTITKSFEGLAAKKGLVLIVDSEGRDFTAELDRSLFMQILENLIHNALKFTENGEVRISVKRESQSFTVKVKDTGIGIPKESQNVIFKEFRQVSEGYGRHFEGTGIGLTLTQKFLELMNGTIYVESALNEGTVFTVRFPLFPDQKPKAEKKEEKILKKSIGAGEMNLKILLVEDDAINRDVINWYLKSRFDVSLADNGAEALKQASTNTFDLILMDINLGKGMNGIEAARQIKLDKKYRDVPIVALTAYAMKGDRENFLSAGFTDYLSKPFLKEELLELIGNLFNSGSETGIAVQPE